MENKYANVCIDISHENVDRPFQYKIPARLQEKIFLGAQVLVPFGRGNRLIKGYVLEMTDGSEYPDELCKEIEDVVENGIGVKQKTMELALWMKRNYGSTLIAALKAVLPVKNKMRIREKKEFTLRATEAERLELVKEAERLHHVAKARLFRAFEGVSSISYSFATRQLNVTVNTLQALEQSGLLQSHVHTVYRNPIKVRTLEEEKPQLSPEQQEIVDSFLKDYRDDIRRTYLIHGVTGSGKTEVYMEMIDGVLKEGKEAIVLIPEIALTYQIVLRFYRRFGNCVSVIHSKLSEGERYDQYERTKNGEVKVMIGPRSALFTPFENLGLIVIDEEHESSYKSETMPKYHARETAQYIAKQHHASLVLGSATPSVVSYYLAKQGKYKLFTLKNRFAGRALPTVHIVDLRMEMRRGNLSVFSEFLYEKLEQRIRGLEQSMLFLNRRGYAGFISCRICGYVAKCPHCDVSLTEHKVDNFTPSRMVCHYCGYEEPAPRLCPKCRQGYIGSFRAGTQQVEKRLEEDFPYIRIMRMDADTTKKKNDYEKILSVFANGEAHLLIGTQMIIKGHDFPRVTLMGVLAADLSLFTGDYGAAERTFQLLTQAVGRAGRGQKPGEAVIQTYQPDHYAIRYAAAQDYEGFYEEEIAYRKLCGYLPFSHLLTVLMSAANPEKLEKLTEEMSELLRGAAGEAGWIIIGPADATVGKISDNYRKVIHIKHREYEALVSAKDQIEAFLAGERERFGACTVHFDFDPMSGY